MLISLLIFANSVIGKIIKSRHDLRRFWDDDNVELFSFTFLQDLNPADNHVISFSEALTALGGYRSGLSYSVNGEKEGYIELRPESIVDAIIPKISYDERTLNMKLSWKPRVNIHHSKFLELDVFENPLGSITGREMDRFFCWLTGKGVEPDWTYRPFDVLGKKGEVLQRSFTSDDFLGRAVQALVDQEVTGLLDDSSVDRLSFSLLTSQDYLDEIDIATDPTERDAVSTYFKRLQSLREPLSTGIEQNPGLVQSVLLERSSYVYLHISGTQYWKFAMRDPKAKFEIQSVTLPKIRLPQTGVPLTCDWRMSKTEYWLWRLGVLASFFVGVYFLYTAWNRGNIYHHLMLRGKVPAEKRGLNPLIGMTEVGNYQPLSTQN